VSERFPVVPPPERFDLGGGAVLRRYRLEDAEEIFALVDAERERLRRFLPWPEHMQTLEDERAWLEKVLGSEEVFEGYGIWDGDVFAGGAGLHSVDTANDSADLGYWLGRAFEGRGLVTRACRALIGFGFGPLRLHRITIHAVAVNRRSGAVAERLGFTLEGVLRESSKTADGYEDDVVYSLLAYELPPA
jgi:ribosomal-protein-serine acetyltransferase